MPVIGAGWPLGRIGFAGAFFVDGAGVLVLVQAFDALILEGGLTWLT
jgi:hypothetical protein